MDKNNDVLGALAAYREAVTRLKSVMERVGVEPREGSQRRASGRTEEEGRTLRGIVCVQCWVHWSLALTFSTTHM